MSISQFLGVLILPSLLVADDMTAPAMEGAVSIASYDAYYDYDDSVFPDYNDSSVPVSGCNSFPICPDESPPSSCGLEVHCVNLIEFPQSVSQQMTLLNIQLSYFANLSFTDLKNFTELQEISLESNDLKLIKPGTFQQQQKLKVGRTSILL